uniref:Uncharacterized protein n=1 Tax=Arundo donax TaxID=35708 RepID=A0A0A9GQ79_ARUDO
MVMCSIVRAARSVQ